MEEEYYSAYVSSGYRHPQKSRLLKESVRNSLQID